MRLLPSPIRCDVGSSAGGFQAGFAMRLIDFAMNHDEYCGVFGYTESDGTKICQWTLGAGRVSGQSH
jgi:hypothetical protein